MKLQQLGTFGNVARSEAAQDPAFTAEGHRVRYSVGVGDAQGPFRVEAELLYQPIGFRWAENLRLRPSEESMRFLGYYEAMSDATSIVLARDTLTLH